MRPTRNLMRAAALLAACAVGALPAGAMDVQSQEDIAARVAEADPPEKNFVKDQPILGWRLDGDGFEGLPRFIRDNLGSVDKTGYDASYFERNKGSIVALQMTEDSPDFYIIGKSTYDADYEEVPLSEVEAKNAGLVERLEDLPELKEAFESAAPALVAAIKTEPVTMIEMSSIGYGLDEEVTIDSPWGTQTKPAGHDAFLVFDASKNEYYMVNVDEDGLPISYVPAD